MSVKKLVENPPECKECGSKTELTPCLNCHKPVCPKHRYGFGEAGQYFCTMNCAVESTFPLPPRVPTFGAKYWKSHTLFYAAVATFVFLAYYLWGGK